MVWLLYSVLAIVEEMIIAEPCWEAASFFFCRYDFGGHKAEHRATQRV